MNIKDFFKSIADFYDKIYRFLLFFTSIGIIVYLFPTQGKFQYEFQKGRPWKHETLIAPFDFAILKSEQALKLEQNEAIKNYRPYFRIDTSVWQVQMELLQSHLKVSFSAYISANQALVKKMLSNPKAAADLEKKYYLFLSNALQKVYEKGIVEFSDVLEHARNGFSIMLVDGNSAQNRDVSEIFTPRLAFEYLKKQLVNSRKSDEFNNLDQNFINDLRLTDYIVPNVFFDKETSERIKNELIESVLLSHGMVQAGERIITRGDIVNENTYQILLSLKKEYESLLGSSSNYKWLLLGEIIIVAAMILVLFMFLYHFRREILYSSLKTSFILILIVLMVAIGDLTIRLNILSLFVVPFTILPIIIRTFYDSRLALFIHLVTIILIGFQAPNGFEFVFMQFVAGIVAIMSLSSIHRRRQLFNTAFYVFLAYTIVYSGLVLLQTGDIKQIDTRNMLWFAGNSMLIMSCYMLIFIFEKLFGFLSDVTLMELSDTNHPLLIELAEKAPGTFQHSVTVANLAQEAVQKIGGNPLLVRTGALYHDIGKMFMPQFFIENQKPGENPHDKFEPDESARIIISHVQKGVDIARKHKLPQQIVDFIRSHHGTNKAEYFYRTFKIKYPNKEIDEELFTYPGPVPFSRETAVLMIADAVEAASRSLKNINEETLAKLVDDIISQKINDDQFMYANVTFKDISTVKDIFKKKLINIYHSRIEYPKDILPSRL